MQISSISLAVNPRDVKAGQTSLFSMNYELRNGSSAPAAFKVVEKVSIGSLDDATTALIELPTVDWTRLFPPLVRRARRATGRTLG